MAGERGPLQSLLLGRIRTLLEIENDEVCESLVESLTPKDEKVVQPKNNPYLSFFGDNYKLRILESLLKNEFSEESNTAISLWITSKLSELISQSTTTQSVATLETNNANSLQLDNEFTTKLLNENEKILADRLIPQASREIKKLLPEDNCSSWQELEQEFNKFRRILLDLNYRYGSTISQLLGEEDDILYCQIFEFLNINGLNTVAIPTIDELGKYKGGYSLVKKISQNNGLKAVRKKYVPWAMRKTAEENPMGKESESPTKFMVSRQDLMTRII